MAHNKRFYLRNTMMKYLVVCAIAATYMGTSWSLPTTLTCPDCISASYHLINIPSEYVDSIRNALSNFLEQYNDFNCSKNTVTPRVCPSSTNGNVSTCDTMWVKMQAIGMKPLNLPASGVEIVVITRSCGTQAKNTEDLCTSLHDLPSETDNSILSQLSQLKTLYDSVTYDGQFCQSSTGNTTALDDVVNFTNDANPVAATFTTALDDVVNFANDANPAAATFWASILFLLCVIALVCDNA